ncbi:MAG: M23 family metallopeptidase [Pseudomonadota bacterium]
MLIKAIVAQLLLLAFVTGWLILSRRRTSIDAVLQFGTAFLLLAGLAAGGVWVYPPLYYAAPVALLWTFLLWRELNRPPGPRTRPVAVLSNLPVAALLPLAGFLIWQGVSGRLAPNGPVVDLASPFSPDAKACVLSGGTSPLLNLHNFPSDDPGDIAQRYALDFVITRADGFRTRNGYTLNPKPQAIEAYSTFGAPVFAPCDGMVAASENMRPDEPIGGSDRSFTAGNFVVLQCGAHHIHLHHFQEGGVAVETGDVVRKGDFLGRIGNSGNTREPHLHFHAETIVDPEDASLDGEPVHMRFDGRFLARGSCL